MPDPVNDGSFAAGTANREPKGATHGETIGGSADPHALMRLQEVASLCVRAGYAIEECLKEILEAAIAISGAQKGNVQLLDSEAGVLVIAVQRGFEEPFLNFFARVAVGEASACGAALEGAERVVVEDVMQSSIFAGQPSREVLLTAGVRAVQSTPLTSSTGKVLGMISTHFTRVHRPSEHELRFLDLLARQTADYLERKQAEEAFKALATELRNTTETLATGLTHCSRKLRYLSANPAYSELAGLQREQIVGRPIVEVMGEHAFEVIRPYVDRVLRGELVEYEAEVPWSARGRRWLHVVYAPYREENGEISGWVASVTDISDRKRAEGALRDLTTTLEQKVQERTRALKAEISERQRAESALERMQRLEAIGQLTGGVAHDFNNLLTVIYGEAESIARAAEGNERIQRMAAAAMRAAERGAQLTNQLLSFAGRQQLRPVTLAVDGLLHDLGELVRRTIGESITVDIVFDPELWLVHLDPAQFESAVLNLAINSRDAMPSGGQLAVRAANVTISADRGRALGLTVGDYVTISVADTGIGMSAEVQRRAFEPFYTTKEVGKGTGLGLSQVYGFARQSGGTATVESVPGAGTTVVLYLPRARGAMDGDAPSPEAQRHRSLEGTRVLLVEDQMEVRQVVEAMLADLGLLVVTSTDVVAAHKVLEGGEKIDLLVTDVVMPNRVNGLDLARDARRLRPDLKIVVISGYLREVQNGPTHVPGLIFLTKPFRPAQLADAIAAAFAEQTDGPEAEPKTAEVPCGFMDDRGVILGRDEFEAEGDAEATAIAQ